MPNRSKFDQAVADDADSSPFLHGPGPHLVDVTVGKHNRTAEVQVGIGLWVIAAIQQDYIGYDAFFGSTNTALN